MSQLNSTHQLQRTDPAPPHHRYKEVFFLVASCTFKTSVRVRPNVSLQIIWSEMFLRMEPPQQTSDASFMSFDGAPAKYFWHHRTTYCGSNRAADWPGILLSCSGVSSAPHPKEYVSQNGDGGWTNRHE